MMHGSISNRIRILRFMNGEMSQAELGQRILTRLLEQLAVQLLQLD